MAVARLGHRLSAVDENFFTQRPTTPTDLVNFGRIQNLPLILGLVLAVMALLTVAHLLANVISIGPAVTAMRIHPASVLREE